MPDRECPECGGMMVYEPAFMYYICPECGFRAEDYELDELEDELNNLGGYELNYHNNYETYE